MQKQVNVSTVLMALFVLLSMSLNPIVAAQTEPTPTPSGYGELLNS